MARSRWKMVYFEFSVWRKLRKMRKKKYLYTKPIIYSRRSTIPSLFYPFIFNINKGKTNSRVIVSELHVGYKFGEFSFTRKPYHFPMKRSNKKNNNLKRR